MKRQVLMLLTLLLILICSGCTEKDNIEENTADWGTVYNSNTDATISISETEQSLSNKFKESDYTLSKNIGDEQTENYNRYEFDSDLGMLLSVEVMNGEVTGIIMTPTAWADTQELSEDEAIELALQAKSDWYFKESITAQTTMEQVYEVWGEPNQIIESDTDVPSDSSLGDRTEVAYYNFNDKWEQIPSDSSDDPVYSIEVTFLDDKVVQVEIG